MKTIVDIKDVGNRIGDISDLPNELKKEIRPRYTHWLLNKIRENLGGIITIDEALVIWYRKTKEIKKRTQMNGILYGFVRKGLLKQYKDKRGWFILKEEI